MHRSGEPRRWTAIALAILCLVAWLSTPWHLAVEPHDHDHPVAATHDHGEQGHDHAPAGGHEPHDAADHLLPASTRPAQAPVDLLCLAPPWATSPREPPPAWVPPRAVEPAPKGDPRSTARRPRAPPVG